MDVRRDADADYILGSSESEQERLQAQGDAIAPLTERIFRQAGIGPGMRVLDVGCGVGDVSILVAHLVGTEGAVVGVDREAASLETAGKRVAQRGLSNVRFAEGDFRELGSDLGVFDAAVGRLVLMYQADPVATVRALAERLRPGGTIVFQEYDSTIPTTNLPPLPLREQCGRWIWDALGRSGVDVHMGMRLWPVFTEAGLVDVEVRAEGIVQTPDTCYPTASLVRMLLPKIVEYGLATEEEVGIDTLQDRLDEEIRNGGSTSVQVMVFGAWGHRDQGLSR